MKNISLIIVNIISLTISGCLSGNINYKKPSPSKINDNFITINLSKEEAWKNAIPRLGKNFFVINNLDKSSGLINLSYSGNPEKYIDCGEIISTVTNLRGE